MGLIDRAFGVDKNSMLVVDLINHWGAVLSHYENFLLKSSPDDESEKLIQDICAVIRQIIDQVDNSKKGFGVVNFNDDTLPRLMGNVAGLHRQLLVETEKSHWLPQAVSATLDIIGGNRRPYQRNNYWFRD